ncbi:hypothetical protein M758_12G116500 [Ceratodon purpureus]|nr:hypothetical protein M758_12G116500 [Ceratodon purpureus]
MWAATVSSPSLTFNSVSLVTRTSRFSSSQPGRHGVRAQASGGGEAEVKVELRTCRTCKKMFNPLENHPRACRFHTAHYGGETKRKFESVYTGGTMDTIGGGEVVSYWHCCGAADAFDPGCEASPHMSYDD